MTPSNIQIFSGTATPDLAAEIAAQFKQPLGRATVGTFSDGECRVEIEESVRGQEVFVVQSTISNDAFMELLMMLDALKRASVKRVTAVVPYFGYGRQDRRPASARVPVSARVCAKMLSSLADQVITMDLHAAQIEGFFEVPVDNIYGSPVLLGDLWKQNYSNLTVVSPDVGGVVRARALAKQLDDAGLVIIDKRRPEPNASEVMNVIGDAKNRTCVIVDDMVDTAGTLCQAAKALKESGAAKVVAYCTHPVLSGPALDRLEASELDELVVTNSIPFCFEANAAGWIRPLSIAELLAETMRRIANEEAVSPLYQA
jgi:ribose-phosphate pyrophosphokinase